MPRAALGVLLTLIGPVAGLAAAAAAQDAAPPAPPVPPPSEPVAVASGGVWIDPVLPATWGAPQDTPPADEWRWDADALLSVHAIEYGSRNAKDPGLETETASLIVTARHGEDFRLWIEADLDGEDTENHLTEAWGEWALGEARWLRVGQFRVALGTEFATRGEDLLFPGYAFPGWLAGRYDSGVRYDSYPTDNLWQQLTAVAGVGFDLDGEERDTPLFAWRAMITPDQDERRQFEGFFGGLAFGYSPDGDDHVYLATPAEQTIFTTPDLDGEETQWLVWEVGVRSGSFRFGIENVAGKILDVPTPPDTNDMDELGSFSAYTAWNFTGPAPAWVRGGWAPYTHDDYAAGIPLPIEFGLRYSNADIDRDLFDFGITTYDPSSQETRTLSAALSAHVGPDTRLALEWVGVIADDDLSVFDGHNRTSNWILRWDQWFGR